MRHETDWKILVTLGFFVATIAVPTVASLLTPPEREAVALANSKPAQASNREPASAALAGSKTPSIAHVITLDVSCVRKKLATFKAEGSFVQIKGKDCRKKAAKNSIAITNKTNGFTASIFELNGNEYQTDLIQLKPGENQILVQVKSPAGSTEEQTIKVEASAL